MDLLRKIWAGWKAFGHFMGNMLARVVLSVFYFTVFLPFGLGVRWFSDPLQLKAVPEGLWRPRTTNDQNLVDAGRQY